VSYDPNTGKALVEPAFTRFVLGRFRRDTQLGMPQVNVPTVPEMPAAKRASERPGSYSVINPR
jgi:hypothetical protein